MFSRIRYGLLLLPLLLIAARCVDHTTLYRDEAGNLHIVGEIRNDTDFQGRDVVVSGTLYDDAGRVLATAQTPICPYELSPHTFSTFDIAFPNSASAPQPSRYDVHVVAGRVVDPKLAPLQAKLADVTAHRVGSTVHVTATLSADPGFEGRYYACAAFYGSTGDVVREVAMIGLGDLPRANVKQALDLSLPGVPSGAIKLRFWVVKAGTGPLSSNYRGIVTDFVTVQ